MNSFAFYDYLILLCDIMWCFKKINFFVFPGLPVVVGTLFITKEIKKKNNNIYTNRSCAHVSLIL